MVSAPPRFFRLSASSCNLLTNRRYKHAPYYAPCVLSGRQAQEHLPLLCVVGGVEVQVDQRQPVLVGLSSHVEDHLLQISRDPEELEKHQISVNIHIKSGNSDPRILLNASVCAVLYVPRGPVGLHILFKQSFGLCDAARLVQAAGRLQQGRAQLLFRNALLLAPRLIGYQRTKLMQNIVLENKQKKEIMRPSAHQSAHCNT